MERRSLPTLLIATDTWELVYDYNRILLPRGIRTAPHPLNHRLLTRVREHQPVAILLDFSVAEREHGLFLLDALRHDARTAACPVIVILDDPVAYATITSRAYLHVRAHLKPIGAELLLSLVGEYAPMLPLAPRTAAITYCSMQTTERGPSGQSMQAGRSMGCPACIPADTSP